MIFSMSQDELSQLTQKIETISYFDDNKNEWVLTRVKDGFIISYQGLPDFKDETFNVLIDGNAFTMKNTGVFFVHNSEFDVFYSFRSILSNNETSVIWENVHEFIQCRLNEQPVFTKCELPDEILNQIKK